MRGSNRLTEGSRLTSNRNTARTSLQATWGVGGVSQREGFMHCHYRGPTAKPSVSSHLEDRIQEDGS